MRESDIHPHVRAERAELFDAFNGGSTETEHLELIASLIRTLKPSNILETGAFDGMGTECLASAAKRNGFGIVHSLEISLHYVSVAKSRIDAAGLTAFVEIHQTDSFHFMDATDIQFDFAFFDSHLPIRPDECLRCIHRGLMKSGSVAVFHDTSRLRTWDNKPDPHTAEFWAKFNAMRGLFSDVFEFKLSRGLLVARVN